MLFFLVHPSLQRFVALLSFLPDIRFAYDDRIDVASLRTEVEIQDRGSHYFVQLHRHSESEVGKT